MKYYTGIDLHSNSCFMGIIDETDKRAEGKRVPNVPELLFQLLKPFKEDMTVVTVESTYNRYWLVDFLMNKGFPMRLANPAAS